jgi:hypothetical protein
VNYNTVAGSSATETVESADPGWTIAGDAPALPNITSWQRRELSPTQHVWFGPDNNGQGDDRKDWLPDEQILMSPVLHVGANPLTLSFQHRFAFETGNWDGGVIEISTDGATWTDIGGTAYNGTTNPFTATPIGASRPAFVGRSAGWPNFTAVTRNLGTTYANQDVRIRFRIGADESTGAPGWDVDNIAIGGLAGTPFTSLVAQTGVCSTGHGHR